MNMPTIVKPVLILVICIAAVSCTDMDTEPPPFGPLAMDTLSLTDSIPASYGKLISVTTTEIYPGWAQLWFQKDDGTIVTVFLDFENGRIRENALLIPRS